MDEEGKREKAELEADRAQLLDAQNRVAEAADFVAREMASVGEMKVALERERIERDAALKNEIENVSKLAASLKTTVEAVAT
jgi:hypothetical protein